MPRATYRVSGTSVAPAWSRKYTSLRTYAVANKYREIRIPSGGFEIRNWPAEFRSIRKSYRIRSSWAVKEPSAATRPMIVTGSAAARGGVVSA